MISRLRRKEKTRSGIQRAPVRDHPRHRIHVRRHVCERCGSSRLIECAHLSWETGGGMGLKSHDAWTFPACHDCHIGHQHRIGEPAFWSEIGKDPWETCFKYAVSSPVGEVVEYARTVMRPIIDRFHDFNARREAMSSSNDTEAA